MAIAVAIFDIAGRARGLRASLAVFSEIGSAAMQSMQLAAAGTPLQWTERPPRRWKPGELRLQVNACAVCRTDLHVADGELPDPHYPIIPGHEIIGRVIELGPGTSGFLRGDRVGVLGWGGPADLCVLPRRAGKSVPPGPLYRLSDRWRLCTGDHR